MGLITKKWYVDGVLTAPTSIKLSDSTGTFGVKRNDTDEVIVADDTAMTLVSTGIYNYSFDSIAGVKYDYVVEVVYGGDTFYIPSSVTFSSSLATDTLLYVRTKAAKTSGRYDLVDSEFGDNGMDYFINQAQKWLDQKVRHPGLEGRYLKVLSAGDQALRIERAIAITGIWLTKSDGTQFKLVREDLNRLLLNYQSAENGTPVYWCYDVGNISPQQESVSDLSSFSEVDTIVLSDPYEKASIRLFPPADDTGWTLQAYGRFYSPLLVDDGDKSWWTVNHPELLVAATIAEIEGALMTESASNSWYQRVERHIYGIYRELTERNLSVNPVVEG